MALNAFSKRQKNGMKDQGPAYSIARRIIFSSHHIQTSPIARIINDHHSLFHAPHNMLSIRKHLSLCLSLCIVVCIQVAETIAFSLMSPNTSHNLKDVLESPTPSFERNGSISATRILECQNSLGECIIYDDKTNTVLWTDIYGKGFHSLNLSNGEHAVRKLPKLLCAFGLRDEGSGYLFAWEDGFQIYDPDTSIGSELSKMSIGEDVNPHKLPTRLNDGRCDPTGKRFICGGYYGDIEGMYMKVYKVEMTKGEDSELILAHRPVVDQIQVTNSISWSPDGKIQYLADSPTGTIFKNDYDLQNGTLSNRQVLRKLDVGVPDGSCNDSEGNVWTAVWRNGVGQSFVQCTNPEGACIYTVTLPDSTSQLTCCCFGGPELDVLFVSSANIDVDGEKEPFAGSVYAVKLGMKGRPESRFGLS